MDADELKQHLIETWLGMCSSIDQVTDQSWDCFNAHLEAEYKH